MYSNNNMKIMQYKDTDQVLVDYLKEFVGIGQPQNRYGAISKIIKKLRTMTSKTDQVDYLILLQLLCEIQSDVDSPRPHSYENAYVCKAYLTQLLFAQKAIIDPFITGKITDDDFVCMVNMWCENAKSPYNKVRALYAMLSLTKIVAEHEQWDRHRIAYIIYALDRVEEAKVKYNILGFPASLKHPLFDYESVSSKILGLSNIFKNETKIESSAKKLGIGRAELRCATYAFGPVYNEYNSYGFPILGKLIDSSIDPLASLPYSSDSLNAYVPNPGIIQFVGLSASSEGIISFRNILSEKDPALIFPEDFNTLMALTFYCDIEPDFTLPSILIDIENGVQLNQKAWDPPWLEHTLLGKTLYTTDRILGDIGASNQSILETMYCKDLSESSNSANAIAHKLISDIIFIRVWGKESGDEYDGYGYCIHAYENEDNIVALKDGNNNYQIFSLTSNPRIQGFSTKDDSGVKYLINDSETKAGAIANYLTENYNELAFTLPVYERFRQLMSIYYALKKLKTSGFVPNQEMKENLLSYIDEKQKNLIDHQYKIVDFTHR